jgi:hypothetical protein
MIPLLLEKMAWPPAGSMGPIFSEYLFIRFFQRPGEETKDDRIWPAAKFTELLMQLNCLKVMPDEKTVTKGTEYQSVYLSHVKTQFTHWANYLKYTGASLIGTLWFPAKLSV